MTNRLALIRPELALRLSHAPRAVQLQAMLVACDVAVPDSGLRNDVIDSALRALRSGAVDIDLQVKAAELARQLDEECHRLQSVQHPKAVALFAKARAAAAVELAMSARVEDLGEAVYEAAAAAEDDEQLLADVAKIPGL